MDKIELRQCFDNVHYYLMKGNKELAIKYYSKYKEYGGTEIINELE